MTVTITNADDGLTIKQYLERRSFSARLITRLKARERGIVLNGERKTVRCILKAGDVLELETEDTESSENIPVSHLPVNVLYEDDWYIAVEKPPHLPIHPSRRHLDDTLASRVMGYFEGKSFVFRVLTRLDLDTSGVVLIAKDSISAARFSALLAKRRVEKEYIAICDGIFNEKCGIIDFNIRRKTEFGMEREAVEKHESTGELSPFGATAETHYSVIREGNEVSLVRFKPITGRTHQLRVHSRAVGHPIVGDTLYSQPSPYIDRQALHAYSLTFCHPMTNRETKIVCPVSDDITLCERKLFN